ncbi:MAG: hypothetical protein LBQ76_02795 [Candidatus Fibromonas sp.]|nr:hypothetical protein [Candidatus Fibromonas sp.]
MRFLLLIQLILLLSCSSVEKREALRADHDTDMNIPAIDDFIISLKKEYIERCYMPILKRIPSNAPRPCENDLLQLLERRYSMDYTQEHVDMAADELFFTDIKDRLQKKIKTEPSLRNAVRKRFRNMDEIIAYYKPKYTFRKTEKNNG